MSSIGNLENILTLARLELPAEERETLRKDLDSILGYVDQIKTVGAVELSNSHTEPVSNVTRDDNHPNPTGGYHDSLIKAAPESMDGFVKVKKIL